MYIAFLLVFFLALFLIYIVKKYASTLGLIDIPNERSVHTAHTPRGAGIGFFLAAILVLSFFYTEVVYDFVWANVAIWMVFFMGVWDDYYDSKPYVKFFVFILATILLSFDHLLIDSLGTYFGLECSLGWFALPFTIFAVVGFTNASNLIDGLDGLAGSISIIILATFYLIGYQHNDIFMMVLSGTFISGLFAFLVYNWSPASIFMGDSGSLTLGFIISLLAVKSLAYIPAITIFYIGAIPIMDTLIVMTRRKLRGKSMFEGDQCHIHHVLKYIYQDNTSKTVITLTLIQLLYSVAGILFYESIDAGYLLVFFLVNLIFLYHLLSMFIKKQDRKC
jgi:UDP-GlcNAc:undecaprenyl-phosphate GlcNAc-1-phosphate transferase